ncbi:MAG TPA: hypothetical protein VJX92_16110 [Methylomirabilota bacterium]|nr:hypothetical protein [Methylomirabilota bacterium]
MTPHEYLVSLLTGQVMPRSALDTLQRLRGEIEMVLRRHFGSAPRFYYGGSYGKDTMIREAYDLDIVLYFPHTEGRSLRDLFVATNSALVAARYTVHPKTVALRLPYQGGFHIDVVPGRAQDATFRYATLFKNMNPPSTLQTSLKVHIDAVRRTGIQDIVKLMKLWRLRRGLTWSTFALEIAVAQALQGRQKTDYAACLVTVFNFFVANVSSMRFVDPANTNNVVDVSISERSAIRAAAAATLAAPNWGQVF